MKQVHRGDTYGLKQTKAITNPSTGVREVTPEGVNEAFACHAEKVYGDPSGTSRDRGSHKWAKLRGEVDSEATNQRAELLNTDNRLNKDLEWIEV